MTVTISLRSATPELDILARNVLRAIGQIEPVETIEEDAEAAQRGNRLATAALLLTIPSAVVDTLTLVERAKVVEHVRVLLETTRTSESTLTLRIGPATPLDLSAATVDTVMNHLSEPEKR